MLSTWHMHQHTDTSPKYDYIYSLELQSRESRESRVQSLEILVKSRARIIFTSDLRPDTWSWSPGATTGTFCCQKFQIVLRVAWCAVCSLCAATTRFVYNDGPTSRKHLTMPTYYYQVLGKWRGFLKHIYEETLTVFYSTGIILSTVLVPCKF